MILGLRQNLGGTFIWILNNILWISQLMRHTCYVTKVFVIVWYSMFGCVRRGGHVSEGSWGCQDVPCFLAMGRPTDRLDSRELTTRTHVVCEGQPYLTLSGTRNDYNTTTDTS